MTPKQKYEERRRLRAERLLHQEQQAERDRNRDEDADEIVRRLMASFERSADVLELWADKQEDVSP